MGKIETCSRCHLEKEIVIQTTVEGLRYHTDKPLCKDCWEEENTCNCEICADKMDLRVYRKHLIDDHTNEEMATLILKRMEESKKRD